MRKVMHSLGVSILALAGVLALLVGWTMPPAVKLVSTALIMGPTLVPNPGNHYMNLMTNDYITPYFGWPDSRVPVHTPAQLWPIASLNPLTFDWDALTFDESVVGGLASLKESVAAQPAGQPLVVLGYSQSTRTGSAFKRGLIAAHGADFGAYPDISLVLVSNLNKPNGGILQRGTILGFIPFTIPFVGITFDGATPTNSPVNPDDPTDHAVRTTDFSVIHDGVSDAPVYLNPLTVANAIAGFLYLHNYPPPDVTGPLYQGSMGDTDYHVYGTDIVPILRPLAGLGISRSVLLALDEPLRVVIEATGYRRDINPGVPTPFGLFPIINPIALAANLVMSIPVGLDDAFEDMGQGRPFGTTPSGPYGVGGPALPAPPSSTTPVEVASPSPAVHPVAEVVASGSDDGAPMTVVDVSASTDQPDPADSDAAPTPLRSIVRGPIGSDPVDPAGPGQSIDRRVNSVDDVLAGQQPTTPTDDVAAQGGSPDPGSTVGDRDGGSPDADSPARDSAKDAA